MRIINIITLVFVSFFFAIIAKASPIHHKAVQIASGYSHSIALEDDGTVWAWGDNEYGQLGDGTTTNKAIPVQVERIFNIIKIYAGYAHSLALKDDGTVWAWGRNSSGQLGDGTNEKKTTPVQITGLSDIFMLSTGCNHNLALKNNGNVWAWGENYCGQLGDDTRINKNIPVEISSLSQVIMINAGCFHNLALKNDGTVWAWGNNNNWQLGNETSTNHTIPVIVKDLTQVSMLDAGYYHSLALKSDGTIWSWGGNSRFQLGDGTSINRCSPVKITELSQITMLDTLFDHNIALRKDGTVWAWGNNMYGQLGDGTSINKSSPIKVLGLSQVVMLAAGGSHNLALKEDGTIWAWGRNNYGQLGRGITSKIDNPVQVTGLRQVTMLYAGDYHNFALKEDKTVWAWGRNDYSQLGDGTTTNKSSPVKVFGLSQIMMLAAGYYHSLALKIDGTVLAWGRNNYSQLGDGTETNRTIPVQVSELSQVIFLAAGNNHSMALKDDGTVWAWGSSYKGQLGNSIENSKIPTQVYGLSHIKMLAAGDENSFAVKEDGTVWAWGNNNFGQLGDGTTTDKGIPVQVAELSNVSMLISDDKHRLAIKNDNTVWAWGRNNYGRLGDGTTINRETPVQIIGLSNVISLASGQYHNIALKDDNTVWGWGRNNYGQLGDEIITSISTPIQVAESSNYTMLAAGYYHSLALKDDGTIWAWGNNDFGQLGHAYPTYIAEPVVSEIQFVAKTFTTPQNTSITICVFNTSQREIHTSYYTADGTATAGIDYLHASGNLSFQENQTQKNIQITILNNANSLSDKTFELKFDTSDNMFLNDGTHSLITISSTKSLNFPYTQTFNQNMPASGWTYNFSQYTGRIHVTSGRLRMDNLKEYVSNLNEAILEIDLSSAYKVNLNFFQKSIASDICTSLPETYTGQFNGDGISISNDGHTWYSIIDSNELFTDHLGKIYSIDLNAVESYIQNNHNKYFTLNGMVKIKFQQYGQRKYPFGGRAWDDIAVIGKKRPFFSIKNQQTMEDAPITSIPLILTGTETPVCEHNLSFLSSNISIIPHENISYNCLSDMFFISLTPSNNAYGISTIQIDAFSESILAGSTSFTITVMEKNDSPFVVNHIPDQKVKENEIFDFTFNSHTFDDLDMDDSLSYSASLYGNDPLPEWLTFDTEKRNFTGKPTKKDIGTITINVIATDNAFSSISQCFDLTVYALPVIINLISDLNPVKSKSWNWSSDTECLFRFAIDQNTSWQPEGLFNNIQTAMKSNVDGTWYLHVQAKDTSGILSEVHTVSALLDNTKPTIELSNNLNQWQWSANETSTFRFAVDKSLTWEASGNFTSTTSTTLYQDEGIWYLHVQAKDRAGNMSDIQSRTVILDKPTVQFAQGSSKASEENTSIQLELALSRIVETDVVVQFGLESSQALLDTDFILPNSLYSAIQAGQAKGFIPFTVIDDPLTENTEDITFRLLQSSPVELGWKQTHTCQIIDNDYPGISISQHDHSIMIVEGSTAKMLTMVLDTQPQSRVDILFNCDKIDISPRKLSFLPTEWNHKKSIQMVVEDDHFYQGILNTALIFKVSSSDAYYHDYPIPDIDIQIVGNDPKPLPPEVSGPNSPLNDTSPIWIWISGGGSNTFRYKLDDAILDRGATETTSNWFQSTSELTQGFHTLYVQELNEYTNQWSDSGAFTIEIDTGLPCSSIASISSIDTVSKQLTITYLYDDIYWGEICDKANSGSGIEKVELWVSEPNTHHYEKMLTDTVLDGQFSYTVSQEGKYKFYVRGMDKASNYETNSLPDPNQMWDAESFYSDNFSGYAIILVGSISGQEGLESHTLTANNIYKQLIHRNFWPEHIKYFNPFDEKQPGETDFDEHGGTYADAVENVITQWAPEQIQKLSGPLFIILIDHGSPDIFHLTGTQSLTAYQFNQYLKVLDNLENKEEIVIILGSCFSGSFIDEISAKGRIIITSAAENEPSYRGPKINPGGVRDGGFFITHLFIELTKGNNLLNSFNTAVLRTEIFTLSTNKKMEAPFFDLALQHPLLDDNGNDGSNSLPLNGDGYIAQNIVLGHNENQAVEILQTTIAPKQLNTDENTLSVAVDVHNIDNVKRVWVEIRKPGLNIEDMRLKHPYDNIGLQQSVEMEELDLAFNPQKDTYTLVSDSFDISGQYIIFFYVKDKEGITSGYKEKVVYKSKENNKPPLSFFPISPMNNESSEFSDVILEWESTSDPESDIISYSVILSTDTDTFIKERIYETMSFVSLPKSWDKKEVLWKVQAIDTYGNITETPEWTFKIDNNRDNWGSIVYFQVHDIDTKMPVSNAKVNISSNDINVDLVMHSNGLYIKRFDQSGLYDVVVSAENYTPVNNEPIEIISGQMQSFSFSLDFKSSPGDINRNGKCDIGDAIKCLQVLCDLDYTSYIDKAALIGDVIELSDAIFILQRLSGI